MQVLSPERIRPQLLLRRPRWLLPLTPSVRYRIDAPIYLRDRHQPATQILCSIRRSATSRHEYALTVLYGARRRRVADLVLLDAHLEKAADRHADCASATPGAARPPATCYCQKFLFINESPNR